MWLHQMIVFIDKAFKYRGLALKNGQIRNVAGDDHLVRRALKIISHPNYSLLKD